MEEHSNKRPLLLSTSEDHQQVSVSEHELVSLVQRTWTEVKKIWKVAGPSIFSRLSLYSLAVITQSFAGHLNDTDLAAISIATTVITSITFGFLPEVVAELAGTVAVWLIPMHMSFVFQFSLVRFLQGQLKTSVIGWVSGLALVIHLLLNWFFAKYYTIGVVGAAIMLDFSWWVSVLGLFLYAVCGGCRESWYGFSMEAFSGLWDFFKLSAASSVMLALESFYYRVLVIVAGSLGNTAVDIDALSICITSYGWEIMIPYGFLAATGVRVANELGAGNAKGAIFATKISLLISILIGTMFAIVILAFPDKLAMIFTSNNTVINMVNELSVLLAVTVLLSCIQPVFTGVALGCGWQSQVAIVNLGSYYVVGVPLGVILEQFFGLGIKGLWTGMLSGTVVQTLTLAIITIRCQWDKQAKEAYSRVVKQAISDQSSCDT
uniref:protein DETOXIFICATION 28-like isoform X3 n=1 Tax=Erigeron canadensis TaxID=72917 RepID=UPI001CB9A309|nr:protein DETOXIFICATION 28-like isoform X3 [Erigeron canadensis]